MKKQEKKSKFKNGQRVFHAIFGWCVIDLLGIEKSIVNCDADEIEYYVMGVGYKKYVRDDYGKQIVCVPISELFLTEEEVPNVFALQKIAMNLKLIFKNKEIHRDGSVGFSLK